MLLAPHLVLLAPDLPPPSFGVVLPLLQTVRPDRAQGEALAALAPHLPKRRLAQALEMAQELHYEVARAETLSALAPYLSQRLLVEALNGARTIQDLPNRVKALTALAPYLSRPLQRQTQQEALSLARKIDSSYLRATALSRLARGLPEPQRDQVLDEALAAARTTKNMVERERVLGEIVDQFAEPRQDAVLELQRIRDEHWLAPPRDIAELPVSMAPSSVTDEVEIGRSLHDLGVKTRFVNSGFAAVSDALAPLKPTQPLTCSQSYYFWLEIGEPAAESIEETPTELPFENLPCNALLKVVLSSLPSGFETTPGADIGELQLAHDGTVLVLRQPDALPFAGQADRSCEAPAILCRSCPSNRRQLSAALRHLL